MDLLPVAVVPALFILIVVLYILFSAVKVLREYERAMIFRLGRVSKAVLNPGSNGNGPGLILLIPVVDKMVKVNLRSVLGQSELDELLSARDRINQMLQRIIDEHTEPWGIKVSAVEVKLIDLPQDMQRAMAKQAEAEREKRAKIIHAEGELLASEKLAQAGRVIASEPVTIQLRYLQTLTEIGTEKNSTVIFPIPIDMLRAIVPEKTPS